VIRLVALLLLLLPACAELGMRRHADLPVEDGHELPTLPEPELAPATDGSLWRGDVSRRFLAFENRAKRTGDLITVQILEKAEANTEATTDLERKSSYTADLDSDIALQTLVTRPIRRLLGFLGFSSQKNDSDPQENLAIVDASTNTKFEGDGSVERESNLKTTIACLVTAITPSGLMRIEGQRYITINHETQIIRLTGYVRPEDVQIDNTVSSALIANANIEYGGKGVVSDKQRVPWLTRVFDRILPF
jgi:flagellar L-ring protein precursor FlgH